MILFLDDWKKYPNAVVHKETTNESALRLSYTYKEMGVKNHTFHLALHNPELKDVNPHDIDNLTTQQMTMILEECNENPWYYFREIAMIRPLSGVNPSRFRLNRANVALYWYFFNHIFSIVIQPRQTGKSISVDVLMIGLLNFFTASTFINMLTANDNLRTITLNRMKSLQEELPFYLDMRSKKDIFNTEIASISFFNNVYKGNVSNASPKLANSVGRGFTSPIFYSDEAIVTQNIKIALEAALMAGNAARDEAKKNNAPYGTILTTTAGDIDDRDAQYVYGLLSSATLHTEKFYDAQDAKELTYLISKNSRASDPSKARVMVNITMNHRQLGFTDDWMYEKIQETIAEGLSADRDLFNVWTRGTSTSPIPKEYISSYNNSINDDPYTEIYSPHNYIIRWYIDENERENRIRQKHSFIIGVDTSDGIGRDDIAFVIRDHVNGEIIAVATFNETNLITIADFFSDFLIRYKNAIMVIERRSSAITIIDYIIQRLQANNINPYRRLYNTVVQYKDDYEKDYHELNKNFLPSESAITRNRKHIGFTTSGTGATSRSTLYSTTLINMSKYTSCYTYDRELVRQITTLTVKNNRVDHPDGGHDDLVVASLLSYWFLTNGKNLNFYNINTDTLLKENEPYLREKYSQSNLDQYEIAEIENKIKDILEQYREEKDEIILEKLRFKLNVLAKDLNVNYNKTIATEQLLEEINQQKREQRNKYWERY